MNIKTMGIKDDDHKISLKIQKYVDKEVSHLKNTIDIRDELNNLAIEKAEVRMNDRLEGMNEFREQLTKQAGTFITKEQLNLIIERFEEKLTTFKSDQEKDRKYINIGIGIIVTIQFISFLLFKYIFK